MNLKTTAKQLANRLNLEIITNELENEKIEISRFIPISSMNVNDYNDCGLVINVTEDILDYSKINLIVICKEENLTENEIYKYKKFKIPIIQSRFTRRFTLAILEPYLLKKQQIPKRLHATMLSIFGEGVLIIGKSGIGKSEVALELINRNHLFVGDDAIDVISFAGQAIGKAPKISRDFIEVRGVGVINIKGMFGIQSLLKEHQIDLIIELVNFDDVKSSIERLGKEFATKKIVNVDIPFIQIPVSSGKNIATIIESAIIVYKQRVYDNYISINDLNERIKNNNKNN